ncbi:MAG: DNA repair protein RecO [Kiritimatiellales bacterium]|nr:DNA repair protein RecO [Kiritimatiellales bacterium]
MIVKTVAIPLAYYPVSNTSRVVHWMTKQQGKISTMLKGALRPKSMFLGGYSLFSTSELLYYDRGTAGLFTGKECSLLHSRPQFRDDWRAMMAASYITALFAKTTPEHAPQDGLFELYEELLDLTVEFGRYTPFFFWAELRFCDWSGHAPNLGNCIACKSAQQLRFSAELGGTICTACVRAKKLSRDHVGAERDSRWPTLESPPDVLAILRRLQQSAAPHITKTIQLTPRQTESINHLLAHFTIHQLDIPPSIRHKALLTSIH